MVLFHYYYHFVSLKGATETFIIKTFVSLAAVDVDFRLYH